MGQGYGLGRWSETVAADVRYAIRLLRKRPFFTAAVILTLTVGIGVPTTAFSLLNALLFRTPVRDGADAFFRVMKADGQAAGVATTLQYRTFREGIQGISELTAWSTLALSATIGPDDPSPISGLLISCDFFHVFGVEAPTAGRLFNAEDCSAAAPVVVLSERLWWARFGGDPAVLGKTLRYGSAPVTVVGVVSAPAIQRRAHDPDPDFVADLWFPYTAQPALRETLTLLAGRNLMSPNNRFPWLELGGLLEPGATRPAVAAALQALNAHQSPTAGATTPVFKVTDGSRWAVAPMYMMGLAVVTLAFPALILLMACVNVAALLLTRAVGRQGEMAVRLALGTSRTALVRMLLVECLIISALSVFLSVSIVYILPPLLVRFLNAEVWFGAVESLAPDWRVFACLGLSGLVAAVLSAVAPAVASVHPRVAELLQGRRTVGPFRGISQTRLAFLGIQIAACVAPLVLAVACALAANRLAHPGFEAAGILVAEIRGSGEHPTPVASLADVIATTPGVQAVGYTRTLPLMSEGSTAVRIPGLSGEFYPLVALVSSEYFEVMGIPIVAGRSFERGDAKPTPDAGGGGDEVKAAGNAIPTPIVVSRQFARRFFRRESIVGEIIETGGEARGQQMVVVGVCADRVTGFATVSEALNDGSMIYRLAEPATATGYLLVRANRDTIAVAERLRSQIRGLTGSAVAVAPLQSRVDEKALGIHRLQMLLASLGAGSLLLAIVGIAGTVSADACQRKKEFAIRSALGATPSAVRRRIVLSGLKPVAPGLGLGLLGSWAALRAAESQRVLLLGSVAAQPTPYATVAIVLLAVVVFTLMVLAHRIVRRDPLASLREE